MTSESFPSFTCKFIYAQKHLWCEVSKASNDVIWMKRLILVPIVVIVSSIIAFGLFSLGNLVPMGFGSASVITVPDDYSTVSAAVAAATDGDTIFVRAGSYSEPDFTLVDKSLTIVGEDVESTIIDGNGTAKVIFQVLASNVTIENFTLRNTDVSLGSQGPGVRISNALNTALKNLEISNVFDGVQILSANFSTISNCTFSNNVESGLLLRAASSNNTFTDNVMRDNVEGLRISDNRSQFNEVYGNDFENNTHQLLLVGGINYFDEGYPAGGNFWSDYVDVDLNNGQYQNVTGSDGIFDHAYLGDNYPLTNAVAKVTVPVGDQVFSVQVSTNSTLTGYGFNESGKTLRLSIAGHGDQRETARVIIPRTLLSCEVLTDWNVAISHNINSMENLSFFAVDDTQATYIFVGYYPTSSSSTVTFTGTSGIPEYAGPYVLLLSVLVFSVSVLLFARRPNRRTISRMLD